MINFYRRFLPGVARTLQPLTTAFAANPKVPNWLLAMDSAFTVAKAALIAAVPWLTHSLEPSSPWQQTPPTPMSERSYRNK
jgi:hypothetical protein